MNDKILQLINQVNLQKSLGLRHKPFQQLLPNLQEVESSSCEKKTLKRGIFEWIRKYLS